MKIQRLDLETSNRIAAGEVVDRPASVIKELCENALDAGASAVSVEIEGGGMNSMRVVDNGSGIDAEDLPLAFERFATGKIRSGDSLMGLETLGFRGEALSSIAAVAQVEALSRTQGADMGSRVEIHGGVLKTHMPFGCPEGTAVIVRNLFFNTPARLKFVKNTAAESARISDVMLRIMLANPCVSFRFFNNGKLVMQTPGTGLEDAIRAIYGQSVLSQCIPVAKSDALDFCGYVGKPTLARATRVAQTLVVNGRFIRNDVLANAVARGYSDRLMTGRFPFFVLHLNMPFASVDVNVHPQKLQVRFTDEALLSEKIAQAVKYAWQAYIHTSVTTDTQSTSQAEEADVLLHEPQQAEDLSDEAGTSETPDAQPEARIDLPASFPVPVLREPGGIDLANSVNDKAQDSAVQLTWEAEYAPVTTGHRVIGQLFSTYLLVESGDAMLIIDQHAAHERLVYDALRASIDAGKPASQELLPPVVVELTYAEMESFISLQPGFEALGFAIERFGETSLIVRAIPVLMDQRSVRELFTGALDLAQGGKLQGSLSLQRERIIRFACRHSVKAGDALSGEELRALVARLKENETLACPHGRPIAIRIDKRDLEKGFKRIV